MKKFVLLLCLLLVQNYAFSQQGIKNFIKSSNMMIGLTHNNWMQVQKGVEIRPVRNRGFDFALMNRFGSGAFGLSVGLGLSNVNIHSNINPWMFDSLSGEVGEGAFLKMDRQQNGRDYYIKNKLSLTYFEVPIELSFKAGGKNDTAKTTSGFKFAIGIRPGFCIDAHTKVKTTDGTIKVKDFDNISRLRVGPTVRIGYGIFSLYARYDLTSTFDAEKVPDYTLYSFGIMLSGF